MENRLHSLRYQNGSGCHLEQRKGPLRRHQPQDENSTPASLAKYPPLTMPPSTLVMRGSGFFQPAGPAFMKLFGSPHTTICTFTTRPRDH